MSGRHAAPAPRSPRLTIWTFELLIWRPVVAVVEAIRDEWRFLLHVAVVAGFSALVIFGAVLLQLSQGGS